MQQCKVLFRCLFAAPAHLAILKLQIMQGLFPQWGHVAHTVPGEGASWNIEIKQGSPRSKYKHSLDLKGIEGATCSALSTLELWLRPEVQTLDVRERVWSYNLIKIIENCCYDYLLFIILKWSSGKCEGL